MRLYKEDKMILIYKCKIFKMFMMMKNFVENKKILVNCLKDYKL